MQVDALIRLLTLLNPNQSLDNAARSLVEQANLIFDNDASAFFLPVDGLPRCLAAAGLYSDHLNQTRLPDAFTKLIHQNDVVNILTEKDIDLNSPETAAFLASYPNYGSMAMVPFSLEDVEYAVLVMIFTNPGLLDAVMLENLDVFKQLSQIGLENIIQRQKQIQAERDNIARELHDAVTQAVYGMTILAEGRRRLAASGRLENCVESFSELGELAQQALRELRLVVHGLRNPLLENLGLVEALKQRLLSVEKRSGVETDLIVEGEIRLPLDLEAELYRIAEEALNNMLKYSFASAVVCKISQRSNQLILEIWDDGRGFDLKDGQENGGMGLSNMAERADKIGALLNVETKPGSGTVIRVAVNFGENFNEQ